MSGALDKLKRKLAGMIVRGAVKVINDAGGVQMLQVKVGAGHLLDDIEHVQPFGLTSVPEPGSEAVVLFLGGDYDKGMALVTDRRKRPKGMSKGQVALYDSSGHMLKLCNNGTAELMGNSDAAALASKVDTEINRIWTVLTGWTVVPADGGAALKTAAATAAAGKLTVASTKVKMS